MPSLGLFAVLLVTLADASAVLAQQSASPSQPPRPVARALGNALIAPIVILEPGNPERVRMPGTVLVGDSGGNIRPLNETADALDAKDDYYISAIIAVHDPNGVRMPERVKAGKFAINGVSLAPIEKTQEKALWSASGARTFHVRRRGVKAGRQIWRPLH